MEKNTGFGITNAAKKRMPIGLSVCLRAKIWNGRGLKIYNHRVHCLLQKYHMTICAASAMIFNFVLIKFGRLMKSQNNSTTKNAASFCLKWQQAQAKPYYAPL